MFWKLSSRLLLIGALAAVAAPTLAAVELVGAAPASTLGGEQVDNSTGPFAQTYTSSVSGTIESIVWWGFHGSNSGGAANDAFIVKLNDDDQTGPLSVTIDTMGLSRYELDIVDTPLVPGDFTLDIVNDSWDVEWFWQYDNVGQSGLAYALFGTPAANVPEPQALALALAGLVALAAGRRRRSSR